MQDAQKWAPSSRRYSLQLTEIPSVGRWSTECDLNKKASWWSMAACLWHSCLQHCTKAEKLQLGHVGFLPAGYTHTHTRAYKRRSDRLHNLAEFWQRGLVKCGLSAAGGGSAGSSVSARWGLHWREGRLETAVVVYEAAWMPTDPVVCLILPAATSVDYTNTWTGFTTTVTYFISICSFMCLFIECLFLISTFNSTHP